MNNEIRKEKTKDLSSKGDSFKISTNENFYRSSSKFNSSQNNFSKKELYGTLIQNIKLDIQNIQNSINENSDILIFFKNPKSQSILPQLVNSKIKEIEMSKSQDINSVLDNISMESQNIEKLADNYSCKNHSELVTKLALQVSLYDCYVKKVNELSFLLNLRYNNEKNNFSESVYQDSYSKYNLLKGLIEKFISMGSSINNLSNFSGNASVSNNYLKLITQTSGFELIINKTKNENFSVVENKEDDRLLRVNNIEELLSLKIDNNKIRNVIKICTESFDKLQQNLKELGKTHSENDNDYSFSGKNSYEKLKNSHNHIESILIEKDKLISELKSKLSQPTYNSNINGGSDEREEIRQKDDQIKALKGVINESIL